MWFYIQEQVQLKMPTENSSTTHTFIPKFFLQKLQCLVYSTTTFWMHLVLAKSKIYVVKIFTLQWSCQQYRSLKASRPSAIPLSKNEGYQKHASNGCMLCQWYLLSASTYNHREADHLNKHIAWIEATQTNANILCQNYCVKFIPSRYMQH